MFQESANKWYRKHCQKLRQNTKTKPADKGNYLPLYKISVKAFCVNPVPDKKNHEQD